MFIKTLIFHIVIVFSLSGCATDSGHADARSGASVDALYRGSDCILIRTIRDYRTLDRSHLLIFGPGKRAYFVTLFGPAFELRGSSSIRVESRDDRLCSYGGDALIFGGFGRDKVTIQSISRVSAEQQQDILYRFGLLERAEQAPPEPANVKGAEVEELD